MSQTTVEKMVGRTAEHIAESVRQVSSATDAIGDAVEDGTKVMRRAVKQGGDAAEELMKETTQRIQRHPVLTVAATFAVGVALGTLIGRITQRR
jgi:ElaB/YqjD/DUF883 family membrane-anchored ribosome-binding protein